MWSLFWREVKLIITHLNLGFISSVTNKTKHFDFDIVSCSKPAALHVWTYGCHGFQCQQRTVGSAPGAGRCPSPLSISYSPEELARPGHFLISGLNHLLIYLVFDFSSVHVASQRMKRFTPSWFLLWFSFVWCTCGVKQQFCSGTMSYFVQLNKKIIFSFSVSRLFEDSAFTVDSCKDASSLDFSFYFSE